MYRVQSPQDLSRAWRLPGEAMRLPGVEIVESFLVLSALAYFILAWILRTVWLRQQVADAVTAGDLSDADGNVEVIAWVVSAAWPFFVARALYRFGVASK